MHHGSDIRSCSIDFGMYKTLKIERLRGSSNLSAVEIQFDNMVG